MPSTLSLRTAGRVLRAEGLPALRDRISDRLRERSRRLSFREAGTPLGLPATPVLNVLGTAPTPRLGGLQAQLLSRIEIEAEHRTLALLYPEPGAWRLELAAGGRRLSLTLGGEAAPSPVTLEDAAFERAVSQAAAAVVAQVALAIRPVVTTVVVHLSGASGTAVLAPHARRAAVHPLMTLPDATSGARRLRGSWFAIAGDAFAREVVDALDGKWFTVADDHRAQYHAAAAVASNHLVVLLAQVERLAHAAGVPFEAFLPIIRASVDNVDTMGARRALTGPAARGDAETVARHLAAIDETERPLYRVLSDAARTLAGAPSEPRETR